MAIDIAPHWFTLVFTIWALWGARELYIIWRNS